MSRNAYDLTQGGILRKLLLVAVPIMATSFMQMAYNLTDMFWLGRGVSSEAVAASGSAGMFLWLSMAPMLVGRLGAEIGVSQSLGRKDMAAARGYAQNAIFLAMVLGLAYGLLLMLGSEPLIGVYAIQEASLANSAAAYLAIVGAGIPFQFVSAAITGIFNGSGNSRLSFWANATGLALNMILDPLLILGADWGIVGAAAGTVFCQMVVCALFLIFLKRHKKRPFAAFSLRIKPAWKPTAQILRWSVPVGLESGLFTVLTMVTTRLVAGFGGEALAVSRVGSQIESLSWLIGGGFGSAVTAFVGQNFGAGKWSRVHRGFSMAVWSMVVWGALVTVLMFFGGRQLYAAFLREPEIHAMGAVYLRILALSQLAMCLEGISASAFRGVGKTVPPAVISIACNVLRVPLAYVLASTELGLNGVWWAISIGGGVRGLLILAWYLLHARSQPKADVAPKQYFCVDTPQNGAV
ncbi:MAG: MATE family efflux transporter [Clostridia bacterium]|nr:MATE family efflux transporter [Clostridia bacterium]